MVNRALDVAESSPMAATKQGKERYVAGNPKNAETPQVMEWVMPNGCV